MLGIQLAEDRADFRPGDLIAGTARWQLSETPDSAEIRLCWFTRGKGTEDSDVVETQTFPSPRAGEQRAFQFRAPAEPYSFSGKLISLLWAIELVTQPGDQFERVEIVIGPDAREIELPSITPPPDENPVSALRRDVR